MRVSKNLKSSFGHLGSLLMMIGGILLIPILVSFYYSEWSYLGTNIYLSYFLASFFSFVVGFVLKRRFREEDINLIQGLFLTGFSWIVISVFGAIPFVLISDLSFVDAYFETVSGFTTTGITMFTDIEVLPRSLIFWRSLIQWIGGLGIITFFLFVGSRGVSEHSLFRGESHKIKSQQPVPNISRTIKILWIIYGGFTFIMIFLLWSQGVSFFDSVAHSFTALSTGGFSPYDGSIGYYASQGFRNYKVIEYIVIFFMFLGGTNFVVHYQVFRGKIRSLWDNMEMRLWWLIILVSTVMVMFDAFMSGAAKSVEVLFRRSLFQVISIGTTTGFETEWIGGEFFSAASRQVFLILMVIGGCVNSTGGGFKVKRFGIIIKGSWNRIKRFSRPKRMLTPLMVDGGEFEDSQLMRVFVIFSIWIIILVIGGLVTALLSDYTAVQSFSGIFSALGNIGPSYMTVAEVSNLNPIIKIFYVFAMLVGRLEVLPIIILLNREVWRR